MQCIGNRHQLIFNRYLRLSVALYSSNMYVECSILNPGLQHSEWVISLLKITWFRIKIIRVLIDKGQGPKVSPLQGFAHLLFGFTQLALIDSATQLDLVLVGVFYRGKSVIGKYYILFSWCPRDLREFATFAQPMAWCGVILVYWILPNAGFGFTVWFLVRSLNSLISKCKHEY